MYGLKIGAIVETFRLDSFDAIKKAAEIGAQRLQMYCTNGKNAPENMTPELLKKGDQNFKINAPHAPINYCLNIKLILHN